MEIPSFHNEQVGVDCIIALLTGFESLVERIRAEPKSSNYHIGGFERLGEQGRRFLASAACWTF